MDFPYKKVLVLGATSGIGHALAERFIDNGIQIIAAGRREDNLRAFVQKHGDDKASYEVFDITQTDKAPEFAANVTTRHPDLDGVMISSGIQRGVDFSNPSAIDLTDFDMELKTNYIAWYHLSVAFLPHLQRISKERPSSLMFISSGIGLVPMMHIPTYCATKSALHTLVLVMREQLRKPFPDLRIIEVFPPAVQSELHDWFADAGKGSKEEARQMGMPMNEFVDTTWEKLKAGEEQPAIGGLPEMSFARFESARQAMFGQVAARARV